MKKLAAVLCSLTILLGAGWPQPKRITVADCTPPQYAQYIDQAIRDWNSFRVTKMVLVVCGSKSDVEIRHGSYGNNPPIADTGLVYDERWNLQWAVIRLNGDVLDLPTITDRYKRYVVSHELGHALGLRHYELKGTVMSVIDGNVWVPTSVDGELLKVLYGNTRK